MTDPDNLPTTTTTTTQATFQCGLSLDHIPTYDGTSDATYFIERLEGAAKIAGWTEEHTITIAKFQLRGLAKQYVKSEATLSTTKNWGQFSSTLTEQFKRVHKANYNQQFQNVHQGSNETVRAFHARVKIAAMKTVKLSEDAAKQAFQKEALEIKMMEQFLLHLRIPLRQRVLSKDPKNLKEALEMAEKEEEVEVLLKPTNQAIRQINPQEERKCYQCKEPGHIARYCKKKTKCFQCNQMGHFAADCQERKKCFKCNRFGHASESCQEKPSCSYCKKPGHMVANCYQRQNHQKLGPVNQRNEHLNEMATPWEPRNDVAQY